MGKGSKKQKKTARTNPYKNRSGERDPFQDDVSDDEIETFHKQRDMIPLNVDDDDAVDSEDDLEYPVLDIKGADDDDSDEGSDDDSDEGRSGKDDNDDNNFDDREIAKMVRQAKYMKQIAGGDDEMSDDAEPEKERSLWGRRKSSYYDADNKDIELQSSDEELQKEEEKEILKIERERASFLRIEDFGLQDDSDQGILGGKKAMTKSNLDGLLEVTPLESYEDIKIPNDINDLSTEEQMDIVCRSAPELIGLLTKLNEADDQLEKVKPLVTQMREGKGAAKGGMHYSEVKHSLLLAYRQAISFYLLLRSDGHPVRDHPVIARLTEINNLFEEMKQNPVNLPSFIHNPVNDFQDTLVRETVSSERRPDVTELSAKPSEVPAVDQAGLSVDNHLSKYQIKTSQKPQDVLTSLQSKEMLKVRANLEAKLKQKGIYNPTNAKAERKQNQAPTHIKRRLETLDDFDDEVENVPTSVLRPSKISQLVATKARKPKFVSGDDDLPKRDDIGERRRKHELRFLAGVSAEGDEVGDRRREKELRVLAGAGTESMDIDDGEDEFYKQVKKQRSEKLQAKGELYPRVTIFPPPLETEVDGKRNITYQIEKNRGLTRHRKKLTKTPRKKYRVKYESAKIRRKGQVRDMRKPSGSYGGEATGINMGISHSVRLKS